jgi:hypothetical protein
MIANIAFLSGKVGFKRINFEKEVKYWLLAIGYWLLAVGICT